MRLVKNNMSKNVLPYATDKYKKSFVKPELSEFYVNNSSSYINLAVLH